MSTWITVFHKLEYLNAQGPSYFHFITKDYEYWFEMKSNNGGRTKNTSYSGLPVGSIIVRT